MNNNALHASLLSLGIDPQLFGRDLDRLLTVERGRCRRLWSYYRNPMRASLEDEQASSRPYRQAQEWGLPRRITGGEPGEATSARREVVIENDIAWRLDAMIDFLFGQPITLSSAAADPARRDLITQLLRAIFASHGGLQFLQQLALIGAIYGHVDVLVKLLPDDDTPSIVSATNTAQDLGSTPTFERGEDSDQQQRLAHLPPEPAPRADPSNDPGATTQSLEAIASLARRIRFEVVEPARALPVLREDDCTIVQAYAQVYATPRRSEATAPIRQSWISRLLATRGIAPKSDERAVVIELITPESWMTFRDERLVDSGRNSLGRVPLVHIQNVAAPFSYTGGSDLEPLLPLQDDLNTRLSDRAYRITMQSFRMYLGKGIDNFTQQQVAPGRMWMSENPDAQIIEFGGDSACPSEDAAIREIREAMDKLSGVSPIAAGAIKGRIGRLTSAAALRVTMLSLLARTQRKRATYGGGIARLCELAMAWLDRAGLFRSSIDERQSEIHWPNPIPLNEIERLDEARQKLAVGVPRNVVLRELGYEHRSLASTPGMTAVCVAAPFVTSCAPYVQVKSDLITQSRRGVALVRESIDQRQKLIDQFYATKRTQLDQAFDADVRQRAGLDADWVIDARRAYAIGLEAIHRQRQSSTDAAEAAIDNLASIDRALQQLELLHDIERRITLPEILP